MLYQVQWDSLVPSDNFYRQLTATINLHCQAHEPHTKQNRRTCFGYIEKLFEHAACKHKRNKTSQQTRVNGGLVLQSQKAHEV